MAEEPSTQSAADGEQPASRRRPLAASIQRPLVANSRSRRLRQLQQLTTMGRLPLSHLPLAMMVPSR